jgi:hypothetical protein
VKTLLNDAAALAVAYLDGLEVRRVYPSPESLAALAALERPLQDPPVESVRVLAELDAIGSPATVANAGGRYFGFVVGGSLPAAAAANVLAAAWDQNAGLESASPVGSA